MSPLEGQLQLDMTVPTYLQNRGSIKRAAAGESGRIQGDHAIILKSCMS